MDLPLTLVTGASGHVGANLVRALLTRGKERVRVLLREGTNNRAVEGLSVEVVYGDLRDMASCHAAVRGCTYVYHLAAFVSIRHTDREELFDVNVQGTHNILLAAKEAGVRRAVHCSSFGAIRNVAPRASNEDDLFSPYEQTTDYEAAKGIAEGEACRIAAQGLDVVIVNPTGVVGPNDFKPSMVGQSIIEFALGKLKAYPEGGFDFVHVDDVIEGTLLAMENGRSGERYLLTGEWCSMEQIFNWLAEFTGVPAPWLCLPGSLMIPLARIKDWFERTFFPDRLPRFTEYSIALLTSGKWGDHAKAERELGMRFRPVRQGMEEAVTWLVRNGFIPPRTPQLRARL